jgi:hypothetical protein
MEGDDDHFRVYSERTLDASVFCWNPYMDLLGVLPSEKGNHSVSVYRLIDDKQTGSPLLFNEKVPFRPTSIGWVPDKRGLTVGDTHGNVFVFDAERQRTIELQKVHDCAIQSVYWVDLGAQTRSLIPSSSTGKLPAIHVTPASIQILLGEAGGVGQSESNVDDSAVLSNESLASFERQTILSVLGESGRVQLYFGGSIPIGECAVDTLFEDVSDVKFISGSLSTDATRFAVLGSRQSQVCLFLIDTSLLRLRKEEISSIAKIESDIDWLLRQFNQSVTAIDRAVSAAFDDLRSSLGNVIDDIDDETLDCMASGTVGPGFLQDYMVREFSAANKLGKLSRSTLTAYDFLLSTLLSRVSVIVDHLTLRAAELSEIESGGYSGILGLSRQNTAGLLSRISENLRPLMRAVVEKTRTNSLLLKHLFAFLESLVDQSKGTPPICPQVIIELIRSNRSVVKEAPKLAPLLEEGKQVELLYVSLLSNQRRTISSKIVKNEKIEFSKETGFEELPKMRWTSNKVVELVWTDENGKLLIVADSSQKTKIQFRAPEGSSWLLPRFYQESEICAVLSHENTASVSIINYSDWVGRAEEIGPDTYGFSQFFIAQQIPTKGRAVVGMEVSGPRGLCSILCEGGRMITLDLENADDDEEEEEEEESSPSPEQAKRGRKVLKKLDSLIDGGENRYEANSPSSDNESPAVTALAQRLRFIP